MFIDSSAFVAMLTNEPDRDRIANQIDLAKYRYTSGLVRLETVIRTATKLQISVEDAEEAFNQLIEECNITIVPLTDNIARKGVAAFARYGKGRGHPAQLNLADCMAYGAAKAYRCELLFIGKDFSRTDLKSALIDPTPTPQQ